MNEASNTTQQSKKSAIQLASATSIFLGCKSSRSCRAKHGTITTEPGHATTRQSVLTVSADGNPLSIWYHERAKHGQRA